MCLIDHPIYIPHSQAGILSAICRSDGYAVGIDWNRAYPDSQSYQVGYNIYYSSIKKDIFSEGVKFFIPNDTTLQTEILSLTPGDTYFFDVRATEFDPSWVNLNQLPDAGSSKYFPEGLLLSDISESDINIPILDLDLFPSYGVVQIGTELIRYTNKDLGLDSLTGLTRGFLDTNIKIHTVDGYDGIQTASNPAVRFWSGLEEQNENIASETITFTYPNYSWTNVDGYKTVVKDILTTELGGTDAALGSISITDGGTSDESQAAFPSYDNSGWHRTDIAALLRGDCLDTYFGGEQGCADGYEGTDRQVRGLGISTAAQQREELLLEATGEPVMLIRRMWTGIRCKCFMSNSEYPEERCSICFGAGYIVSYVPFYNPRRSDGRILVRFDPTEDDLKMQDAGFESTFDTTAWGLVVPSVKSRDVLQRYNQDGSKEFLYEIGAVTRNRLFLVETGSQKMRLKRIRKSDTLYTFKFMDQIAPMPTVIYTSVSGGAEIPMHVHKIVIGPGILDISQINTTTSVDAFHNHSVLSGIVQTEELHSHSLIF